MAQVQAHHMVLSSSLAHKHEDFEDRKGWGVTNMPQAPFMCQHTASCLSSRAMRGRDYRYPQFRDGPEYLLIRNCFPASWRQEGAWLASR